MKKTDMGDRIREARKNLNVTQEQLAESLGITPYYMGELERGNKTPSLDLFINLVEILNVSADYLLRDIVSVGNVYGDSSMARKLENLTPKQRVALEALIETYIKYLN